MAIYVKFYPEVEGDVSAEGYDKMIEFGSFQFGAGRAIHMSTGSGKEREATKPSLSEVTLSSEVGKHSTKLFLEACVGKSLDKVEINLVKTSADMIETYLTYTLEKPLISSYSVSSGGDNPSESVSIAYTKFEMKYFPRNPDNTLASPLTAGYNLDTGKKV